HARHAGRLLDEEDEVERDVVGGHAGGDARAGFLAAVAPIHAHPPGASPAASPAAPAAGGPADAARHRRMIGGLRAAPPRGDGEQGEGYENGAMEGAHGVAPHSTRKSSM